jgi:valyl-tRNA synthetase
MAQQPKYYIVEASALPEVFLKVAEAKRIAAELQKLAGFIKASEAKLSNENFVSHAPEAVVAEARRKLDENKEKVRQLEKLQKLFA